MEMLTEKDEKCWGKAVWILSVLGVPVILAFYHLLIMWKGTSLFPVIISGNISTMLGIVTTFSITMTGFIAAIGAYLLSISRSSTFSEWRNSGYLSVFFNLYGVTIVFSLVTFATCLMMLLTNMNMWWLKIILSLVIVNLIQIISITYIVVCQAKAND
ncbi:hypothetical protein M0K77_002415 [Providencia rettgeri]|uniref:Uncharacterized protein n=1 Tax=Providencia rettgeri TaxID=587 RepID=A0AAD2ZND7_PRORE|nr:hypothetical protein [Providencia rettgeri]